MLLHFSAFETNPMLDVRPIPAFSDNYIWLIRAPDGNSAFVVDPGDGTVVIDALEAEGLDLVGILITHHHFDHVGGLATLRERYSPVVYGPDNPAIDGIDRTVRAGDSVHVLGRDFDVLPVPGHTLDHIAYAHRGESPVVFCGDTLFAGGCGRLFEGTAPMMLRSLESLAALPPDSFGSAYLAFGRRNGFAVDGILEAKQKGSDLDAFLDADRRWIFERLNLMHDLWHVLTGYETDPAGESALLGFSRSQGVANRTLQLLQVASISMGTRAAGSVS